MIQDQGLVKELIGALGAPGAVMALVVSFYFGARSVLLLRDRRNGNSRDGDLTYKEAMSMTQNVVGVVDKAKDAIQTDVNGVKRELRSDLTVFGGKLEDGLERGFEKVVAKLEKVEEAVRELKHG